MEEKELEKNGADISQLESPREDCDTGNDCHPTEARDAARNLLQQSGSDAGFIAAAVDGNSLARKSIREVKYENELFSWRC